MSTDLLWPVYGFLCEPSAARPPPSPAPVPRPLLAPQSSSARAGGSNLQAARGQPKRSCLPLLCFIRKQNIRFPVH
ncbi:hypothetical protein CesoFtcFv8_007451 [Champsocephalus esox]|uniref:Uncharacterized protein n=1 Tax=Champsocephalus esox TaxID=159716 RepID=A0AAN8H4E8_9TELE|nr:hypothetical protein CesoFtcFv8_007451 [Champsocephalus esox]